MPHFLCSIGNFIYLAGNFMPFKTIILSLVSTDLLLLYSKYLVISFRGIALMLVSIDGNLLEHLINSHLLN